MRNSLLLITEKIREFYSITLKYELHAVILITIILIMIFEVCKNIRNIQLQLHLDVFVSGYIFEGNNSDKCVIMK